MMRWQAQKHGLKKGVFKKIYLKLTLKTLHTRQTAMASQVMGPGLGAQKKQINRIWKNIFYPRTLRDGSVELFEMYATYISKNSTLPSLSTTN